MSNYKGPLAILGGSQAFARPLHVGRPNIGDRDRLHKRIEELLDRNWLTNNGPLVREFEARIAEYVGCKHCVATCNATVALEILARAVGMAGEVIVPSFTFVATAHALQWQHIKPVFCDIDPVTHNLDAKQIEALITPQTSGIMGVHVWGRPCDTDAIAEIADRRHLALIYDAAHAFACSHKGKMIGNFGRAEVFSFHATKFLNSFEGGAVVTNDDALAAKIRLMKNFGFADYDTVIYPGTNGKMTEISAAMGLTSLEGIDAVIEVNRRNYHLYRDHLADVAGIQMAAYDESERNNFQYIVLEVDAQVTGVSRDHLVTALHAENVLARRYFYPGCHQMEPYRNRTNGAIDQLGQTEQLAHRVLILPTGTAVGDSDIEKVCQIVRAIIDSGLSVCTAIDSRTADRWRA